MSPPPTDSHEDAGSTPDGVARLESLNAALQAQNAELRAVVAAQNARIAELERQLGLNSGNSGKPPSSDGLKKKPARVSSLRERSGKRTGGQQGHPGKTLSRTETPDATIDHFPAACPGCGEALSEEMATGHTARQVFDLPEPQPLIVTEHRAHACRCAKCGAETRANFPEDVTAPVQYGARLAAVVMYLLHYQLLPEKRLAALMADLFGVQLVTATIGAMSRNCAARFTGFAAAVRDCVAAAPVKHMDETGFRIGGKTQWLHVASTIWLTFYRTSPKRGSLLENVLGIVVHDHWKPYYTLKGVLHALCNAHHLRELQALVEIEKEDWARKMQRLLRRACHATNLARQQGVTLSPGFIALIERCYDAILAEGFAFHEAQPALISTARKRRGRVPRRIGHNLLLRLHGRKLDVLRFLSDPTVPFTNNLAERDGRMMKLRQKISGGFRSTDGAEDFATIRSLLSTARKQGWDILQALASRPDRLIAELRNA
jgi:transposase